MDLLKQLGKDLKPETVHLNNITMNYEELNQYAEDHFKKAIPLLWEEYTEEEKRKAMFGFMQGYTQCEIDEIRKQRLELTNG